MRDRSRGVRSIYKELDGFWCDAGCNDRMHVCELFRVQFVKQSLNQFSQFSGPPDFRFDSDAGCVIRILVSLTLVDVLINDEITRDQCSVHIAVLCRCRPVRHDRPPGKGILNTFIIENDSL